MKNREEVINSLSELSNKMIMDKECIEAYAKSLGYSINLDEEFNNRFQSELRKIHPVVNYMYNEPTWKRTLPLLKVINIPDVMLFAICNPEIYMVNRFYNIIEKKVKSVIMYSNVYTTNAINGINDTCKEAAKQYETYYDILKLFMEEMELNKTFPYINKYLLKQALKS